MAYASLLLYPTASAKNIDPLAEASISVQVLDRSASQQNLYEEDHLRLPPSTGSIIVTPAVEDGSPREART